MAKEITYKELNGIQLTFNNFIHISYIERDPTSECIPKGATDAGKMK